jgi:hypothetical protein
VLASGSGISARAPAPSICPHWRNVRVQPWDDSTTMSGTGGAAGAVGFNPELVDIPLSRKKSVFINVSMMMISNLVTPVITNQNSVYINSVTLRGQIEYIEAITYRIVCAGVPRGVYLTNISATHRVVDGVTDAFETMSCSIGDLSDVPVQQLCLTKPGHIFANSNGGFNSVTAGPIGAVIGEYSEVLHDVSVRYFIFCVIFTNFL